MNRKAVGLVAVMGLMLPQSVGAWNDFGHMAVAAVAYPLLDPIPKARANALLKLNPNYNQWKSQVPPGTSAAVRDRIIFMEAATWPDEIKSDSSYHADGTHNGNRPPPGPEAGQNTGYSDHARHKYWHFYDTPFTEDGSTLPSVPSPNAQTQIAKLRAALASDAPDALKSYDLSWLLHLVGDVHQPLHSATRVSQSHPDGDDGGNGTKLSCCGSQLHTFWDGAAGPNRAPAAIVTFVDTNNLPAADPTAAAITDETVWIGESFEIAKDAAYAAPVGPSDGPFNLTQGYKDHAKSVAQKQVALAGVRLAGLLNSALATGAVPAPETEDVFVNHNGHAYHLSTCRYTGPSQKVTLSEAKAMGRHACGVCNPPE